LDGAPAGVEALGTAPPRWRRVAVILGLLVAVLPTLPYAMQALRAARSAWTLRPARAAIQRGDLAAAQTIAARAGELNPTAVRPWLTFARWMDEARRPEEAVAAYREALARRPPHWVALRGLPAVLAEAGRKGEAAEARGAVEVFLDAEGVNPGVALEGAWVSMAPPRTDEIRMGVNDYGAARNFLHDRGTFRWTRH